MTALNVPVLDAALRQIVTVPAGWDQSSWIEVAPEDNACGTTMCLAGHVMIASGEFRQVGLVYDNGDEWDGNVREAKVGEKPSEYAFARVGEKYDEDVDLDESGEAARILGIDEEDAEHLFYQTVDMTFASADRFADYVRYYLDAPALVPA